jgi:hypothetical protein
MVDYDGVNPEDRTLFFQAVAALAYSTNPDDFYGIRLRMIDRVDAEGRAAEINEWLTQRSPDNTVQ